MIVQMLGLWKSNLYMATVKTRIIIIVYDYVGLFKEKSGGNLGWAISISDLIFISNKVLNHGHGVNLSFIV